MKIANYKGLKIGRNEFVPVSKEEVNKEIEALLQSKISTKEKEGKSSNGDIVNIDFEGFLDGVAFEGGKGEKYDLELGSNSFIPGFEDALIGYEKGANVDVNVTFPEEYHEKSLAGKPVVFKCYIHSVKEKVESKLDDDLAKEFGIPTADELLKELERQMNLKKKNEEDNEYLDKLVKEILKDSTIDVEDDNVKSRIDEMVGYYEQNIAQYGMDFNTYLQMANKTLEQFRDELTAEAIESVQSDVLFNEIAKLEGISVTDEELEHEISLYKSYYKMDDATFEQFKNEKKNDVQSEILRRKTANVLLDNNN
ncbi:MAG: trigger factor [Acholeplasmatales bacterium]|nr:trigger factor [Acholeplasmatales bacterium]